MQLSITGHHVDMTDALRSYVSEKLQRIARHDGQITNVHVILSVDKLEQKAEANVHTAGADLYADAVAEDMYAAIDALVDKLDRQVGKHKGKMAARKHDKPAPPAV